MITIQQLSQEIGVGVDTLRVWERRFGFPRPERDARGHRLYPQVQVNDLRIIKKLQNLGYRPKELFTMSAGERVCLLNRQLEGQEHQNDHDELQRLVTSVAAPQVELVLRNQLRQRGAEAFVVDFAVPLVQVMDRGWLNGEMSIAREHLLSDCLTAILKEQLIPRAEAPRIVFMTLSGERHKLGLLMAAVLFHRQGCDCHLVLEELPVAEVTTMVEFFAADAIALSFSVQTTPRQAKQDLAWLRKTLARQIKIFSGGFALRDGLHLPGIAVCTDLHQVRHLCQREFPELSANKLTE